MFSNDELERYSRQILLREIGVAGQQKLKNAKVLLIGAGGLSAPAATYLAAAGVGTIGLCDSDTVELSNLQRQILYGSEALGEQKTDAARRRLADLNPGVQVRTHKMLAQPGTILPLIAQYDFILDGTDNFAAKFLINDACVLAQKPFCHAGVTKFSGQLMTWVPDVDGPCYRCVFREIPPPMATCKQGVVGAVVGVIGCLQALEVIKYFTGIGKLLTGKLLVFNALEGDFQQTKLPAALHSCPVCGHAPSITTLHPAHYPVSACEI
ncbi:MAG: HesA/MoeB/ThiF family protein [Oscillospiraceae bacterium]|jgi:molybdopterin/thiamine biosynthesis adenylyltransferase|nr:HesA/MoeB/ThiF family protein [Oscillospiraceae bacterium]